MNCAKFVATCLIGLSLGACAEDVGPKQTIGTVLGAAGGGLLGSQFGHGSGKLAATAAGVFLGGLLGSEVGKSLDKADRAAADRSAQNALERYPDGQAANWNNPNTGHSGYTTPTSTYETAQGPCREYTTSVVIDGRTQSAHGTACREADGTWKIVG